MKILQCLVLCLLSPAAATWAEPAESPSPIPWLSLDKDHFQGWTGISKKDRSAALDLPGEAIFRYPDGPQGLIKKGFRTENDGTADWQNFYGLRLEIQLENNQPVSLEARILPPNALSAAAGVTAMVALQGEGWHNVTLPWSTFAIPQARTSYLRLVKELRLTFRSVDEKNASRVQIRNIRVVRGESIALDCAVRGKAGSSGQPVDYGIQVTNCTDTLQAVSLSLASYGWEAMAATVEPATLQLAAGESKPCTVQVTIPERVPPGSHEQQILQAIANGDGSRASTLRFTTAVEVPHPYLLHTPARWQEVRDKVKNYPWAQAAQADIVKQADAWQVPEVATPPGNDPDDTMGPFLFKTSHELDLMACGMAWQLTGDKKYAEKAALFLTRLSDPQNGYPKTLRGCNQGFVQEGHFFQHNAMAYDMILDSGVLSAADRVLIEATFRIFMESVYLGNRDGAINNWNVSETCGAFYCALAMQDLVMAEVFFSGPNGIRDQLAKGTMDDGWWYECSISYNVWCATEFSQAALAYQPWGVNLLDEWLPASYSAAASLSAKLSGGTTEDAANQRPFGMANEIWGPSHRPYRTIRDLWNSLLPFIDYRGVMFGVNDSTENRVAGQPFEIAYYLFRDPAYAAIVKRGDKRDLLYGVPDLPAATPELYRQSAYADNTGVVMLRSQTDNRPIREQIQAVLHYGSHGWAHGHFDRTNLLSLMRYGRSFYNPEMVWYSYEPFMYKFYVQTSVASNMVVVDQKMQEAAESQRLLYHSGKIMQATAVQTTARWSNPPYGGMVYDYVPVKTFAAKTWREGRFVPTPENAPAYGTLTDYTEKILQRRIMVVTDDYVVLADYLQGAASHTFDSLLQMKGFQGLEAPKKDFLRHDAQWNPDPVGSAQFVTDCNWYDVQAPARSHFQMVFGPGADNDGTRALYSEDGPLNLDVISAWPQSQQIMIGTAPEEHGVQKQLFYTVRGDGKMRADGKFGAWILGQANLDVPVDGVKQLELETQIALGTKPTLFWANARVVTREGKEIPLSQLPIKFENVLQPPQPGRDYFGGPIKIVGTEYTQATPGQPQDDKQPGFVRVDLSGVEAVRFKTVLGGDYPLGNESQRRKTYAIRSQGTQANFLTVIEPYESKSVVKSVQALTPDRLRVELTDGRVQEIALQNFEGSGKDIGISLVESKEGKTIRTETTQTP